MSEREWFVYVVECSDGTLYTGIARDLAARIVRHNEGAGARYTRGRGPVRLVHVESAPDRGSALKREHAIKRLPASRKRRPPPPGERNLTNDDAKRSG